jgi:hypothetical protein
MNTTNILNKLKDFLEKHDYVKEAFPEILEKHNVTNIKSEFADKLDTITDAFERLIVGMHMVDLIDQAHEINQADDQVLSDLNERHQSLIKVWLYMNENKIQKAEESLRVYLAQIRDSRLTHLGI